MLFGDIWRCRQMFFGDVVSIAGEVPNWTNWKNRRTCWLEPLDQLEQLVAHQQHDFDATLWAECRFNDFAHIPWEDSPKLPQRKKFRNIKSWCFTSFWILLKGHFLRWPCGWDPLSRSSRRVFNVTRNATTLAVFPQSTSWMDTIHFLQSWKSNMGPELIVVTLQL